MSVVLSELPPTLADAVRRARASLPAFDRTVGLPEPTIIDPELQAWVREFVSSGELAKAIDEIAASDSDLKS